MADVAILGAGICGLSAAYYLCNQGIKCKLIEKQKGIGGIACSYKINDFWIEKYYHHLYRTDKTFLKLVEELGIKNKIIWRESTIAFFHKNRFYNFSQPWHLIAFKPLKFLERIKFGMNVLVLGKEPDLENMTAEEWLVKKWGQNIYSIIFKPLLSMKFGNDMKNASAAFVHGRLKARADSRKGSKEILGYIDGGFEVFMQALTKYLKKNGCEILTETEVTALEKQKDTFMLRTKDKDIQSKIVLSTIPLTVLSDISDFKTNIDYRPVVCMVLGSQKNITDFYWTNVLDKDLPFGAVIEHTNWIKDKYDVHITYFVNYCNQDSELFLMNEKEITKHFTEGIQKINPEIKEEDILWYRVSKDEHATPVFDKNYRNKIPSTQTNIDGLYLAGSFQVYPESRNMNKIIEKGFEAAELIIESIK